MSLRKDGYKIRLMDEKIAKYLRIFGAVSIEGPKWCGKTWTALNHVNSATYMTEKSQKDLAQVDPKYIFRKERPQLIDEWQIVPSIWDAVRHECDKDHDKGKFILTGSTSLTKEEHEEMPTIVRRTRTQVVQPEPVKPEPKVETLDADDDKYELPPFLRDRNY